MTLARSLIRTRRRPKLPDPILLLLLLVGIIPRLELLFGVTE